MTIPLLYYGLTKSNETIRINQADDALQTITKTADAVYALGLGNKEIITVIIPSGITSVDVNAQTISLFVSIFGGTSEFHSSSVANLKATSIFLNNITNKGTHNINIETYKNNSGSINVLIGGFCGDNICSGTENSNSCVVDCADFCGDGICNYPISEGCEVNYCNDCIGSQADCDSGKFCSEVNGTGSCSNLGFCGDGICAYPFLEDCNSCVDDCQAPGLLCCFDPILSYYYTTDDANCDIPPSVTDCGDYCKWLDFTEAKGYSNGVCRQSVAQCTVHGEVSEPSGNSYCTGDPTIDTCCCIPT